MAKIPLLESMEQFLFSAPLYKQYQLSNDLELAEIFYSMQRDVKIDGHCPFCHKQTTYTIRGVQIPGGDPWNEIEERTSFDVMSITCARQKSHVIRYYFFIDNMLIEKIGQYPSLATISNDEVAAFRTGMQDEDAREFHKAIGLAAHGVGVGSFVYLRRVFERLIGSRFEQFKTLESWEDGALGWRRRSIC